MDYSEFLKQKFKDTPRVGHDAEPQTVGLLPHQQDLARWAVGQGRAAIFADTGLGKSRTQVEWARMVGARTGEHTLILAPLAVAAQTVREGAAIGVDVCHARDQSEIRGPVCVTNYDRLHRFDPRQFGAVVLDESSCIKNFDSKTLRTMIDAFGHCQYRLACTATPAPNDFVELGTHAEFLGVCSRAEMLAEFFVHDSGKTQDWRLKKHARTDFWKWVACWAALVRRPSDLGYADAGYDLPPLEVVDHGVDVEPVDFSSAGVPVIELAATLTERRWARKASLAKRVALAAELVAREPGEQWLLWGDFNAETEGAAAIIPGALEVRGPDHADEKEARLLAFAQGRLRVLVSKPSIAGWGMNFQSCARQIFIGVSDSFEMTYQAIRRSWRFGQTRPVQVHMLSSKAEGSVVDNVRRKEADAKAMSDELSRETRDAVRENVRGRQRRHNPYEPTQAMRLPGFLNNKEAKTCP